MSNTAILLRNFGIAVAATACMAMPAAFQFWPGSGQALAQSGAASPDFAMAGQEDAFRSVADEFVAAAAAGDSARTERMLSPAMVAKTGPKGVERFLTAEVLPFFAEFKEAGRSTTVARTANVTGFAFYMYMVSATDEHRPFVIYVIEEGGAKVIANVLVDHLVENRHCVRVPAGWKCPDFS
jgi:hypothetical protein